MDMLAVSTFVQAFFLFELVGFVTMFTILYLLVALMDLTWNVTFEEGDFNIILGLSIVWPVGILVILSYIVRFIYETWRYRHG